MIKCKNCGSENVKVGVDVFIYVDPGDIYRITKKVIQKKTTELCSADRYKATVKCKDCHHISIGCY